MLAHVDLDKPMREEFRAGMNDIVRREFRDLLGDVDSFPVGTTNREAFKVFEKIEAELSKREDALRERTLERLRRDAAVRVN